MIGVEIWVRFDGLEISTWFHIFETTLFSKILIPRVQLQYGSLHEKCDGPNQIA
jgi:hypothetical protein